MSDEIETLASTILLMYWKFKAPAPPPGVDRAEALCALTPSKKTLAAAVGAPFGDQLRLSDQFVLLWLAAPSSAPVQKDCPLPSSLKKQKTNSRMIVFVVVIVLFIGISGRDLIHGKRSPN